ncbi:hypothetical protein L2E82_50414 [Cichorium intybus]|nr:hypothetical protein L2E82_50414 [Cichorium intybus]
MEKGVGASDGVDRKHGGSELPVPISFMEIESEEAVSEVNGEADLCRWEEAGSGGGVVSIEMEEAVSRPSLKISEEDLLQVRFPLLWSRTVSDFGILGQELKEIEGCVEITKD